MQWPKIGHGAIKQQTKKCNHCKTLKNFELYDPFLWTGFNYIKATEPLRGGSLIFTTKFPKIPGAQFIDLGG